MSGLAKEVGLILRNDLRLTLRSLWGKKKASTLWMVLLVCLALALGHALSLLFFLFGPPSLHIAAETAAWAFFGFLMLGAAMTKAISLLFERADFDLLLSSPLNPRAVLLSRVITITLTSLLGTALLLLPLLNGVIIAYSPYYLYGYGVWLCLAIFCSSLGTVLTLGLVRWIGARKARIWVQIVGAFVGAAIYLSLQLPQFGAQHYRERITYTILHNLSSTPLLGIARAGRGSILDLLLLLLLAALSLKLSGRLMARTFLSGIQSSSDRPARRRRSRQIRFQDGVMRATFRKELRLIARDPLLLSQILPTTVYVLPMLFGARALGGWGTLAPLSVLVATQFSIILTTVAVGGEEGLDLIRSSPLPEVRLRSAKILAAMAVPLALATLLCVTLAILGRPWLALITWTTCIATASGCAWLKAADVQPSPRADILRNAQRRFSPRSIIAAVIMFMAMIGIGTLAAGGYVLVAITVLSATALAIIACFTFVEVKEFSGSV